MRLSLVPEERIFYTYFCDDAANAATAAAALRDMVRSFSDVRGDAARIKALETEGDAITRRIFAKLNRTFITPIEREDIIALASIMDDVVDQIEEIAAMLLLYGVRQPTVYLLEGSELLVLATGQLRDAIGHLEKHQGLEPHWEEVHRIENEADVLYRNAIAELFLPGAEPLEVIKWNRIYDLLEMAFDKCEDVANVIENVVLKNA